MAGSIEQGEELLGLDPGPFWLCSLDATALAFGQIVFELAVLDRDLKNLGEARDRLIDRVRRQLAFTQLVTFVAVDLLGGYLGNPDKSADSGGLGQGDLPAANRKGRFPACSSSA